MIHGPSNQENVKHFQTIHAHESSSRMISHSDLLNLSCPLLAPAPPRPSFSSATPRPSEHPETRKTHGRAPRGPPGFSVASDAGPNSDLRTVAALDGVAERDRSTFWGGTKPGKTRQDPGHVVLQDVRRSYPRHDPGDCHRTAAPLHPQSTTPTDRQFYGSPECLGMSTRLENSGGRSRQIPHRGWMLGTLLGTHEFRMLDKFAVDPLPGFADQTDTSVIAFWPWTPCPSAPRHQGLNKNNR